MQELVSGQIPIWLDIGARVASSRVFVGGYLHRGFGILGDGWQSACDAGQAEATAAGLGHSCTSYSVRLGLQALGHFGTIGRPDPWVGVSFGCENLFVDESFSGSQSVDLATGIYGIELLGLQFGVDLPVDRNTTAMGPFLAFTLGQYYEAGVRCSGACDSFEDDSIEIEDKALHYWVFFGARITILP